MVAGAGEARLDSMSQQEAPQSTPATSVTDGSRDDASSVKQEPSATVTATAPPAVTNTNSTRRSLRMRSSIESCDVDTVSNLRHGKTSNGKDIRDFSGATLVNDPEEGSSETPERRKRLEGEMSKALDLEWEVTDLAAPSSSAGPSTKQAKGKGKGKESTLGRIASKLKSTLGKRGRDATETTQDRPRQADRRQSGRVRSQDQERADSKARIIDGSDSEEESKEPASKKAKLDSDLSKMVGAASTNIAGITRGKKKYMSAGLYLGFTPNWESTAELSTQKRKSKKGADESTQIRRHLPYMMGYKAELSNIDFKIPYDIFAPLKKKENPKEWKRLNRNVFIGDAKEEWRINKPKEYSTCLCSAPEPGEEGCGEDCLNRTMFYECDDNNCNLPAKSCSNRAFGELMKRTKEGNEYDIGVEIVDTKDRGHGIRANRIFGPGQIIMEYCGEVITQEESDRRMNEVYKDKNCYYLMEFDQGMIIDATKGNIARFVNHSCDPNCTMEKRIVHGEPKMALFAGPRGIMTGEELTYDYNFDNFSKTSVLDCRCGSERCRGKLDRRDAKKEKEISLIAAAKRKADDLISTLTSSFDNPEPKRVCLGEKRKTFRAKGWAYLSAEMELKRIEEDALEHGKTLDEDMLADLRARAEAEKKARRGVKTEEEKPLTEREKRRQNRASLPAPGAASTQDRSARRKSMLSRTLDRIDLGRSTTTRSLGVSDTIAVAGSSEPKEEKRKSGLFKQSTLSFPSLSNKSTSALTSSSSLPADPADEAEESQILLSEAGDKKDAKGGLRRSLSSSSKKLLGSVKGSVRRGTKGKENEVAREREGSMIILGSG
ncbi:hypothetical protein MBLNU457_g2744t1 [Dothideomycetes sp. NU457]